MSEHPIQGLMTTAMENLKDMIEVNTIIGDPVESPDGSVIIPVSKVGFGFAAGGSDFSGKKKGSDQGGSEQKGMPFGGGSGGGVSITPVAFLIVSAKGIKMVHLDGNTHLVEKMLDFAPQVVEKIQQMLKESGQSKKPKKQNKEKEDEDKEQQSIYDI
ncbi:GerW family sporulation protein [Lentibacillus sp. Marseille-P4043]|uniref:GerW family sporulation protein n=1 Tax=Lentibacillus sp. Marseille-P4043 TaxID=2040293 RepID=UPI000D0BAB78|nr:GerW family sporulation protein [Lentibacillus sp. Marseille-P4043]